MFFQQVRWMGQSALLLVALLLSMQAQAFDFSAVDVNGKAHTLANERGNFVVINIWATWCPPCRKELPELAAFAKANEKNHIKIWGLSVDTEQSEGELALFAAANGIGYPIFKVNPRSLAPFGNIPGIPATFLINPKGELVARHVGAITGSELARMIQNNK